jgi:hypothetical protein
MPSSTAILDRVLGMAQAQSIDFLYSGCRLRIVLLQSCIQKTKGCRIWRDRPPVLQ